MKSECKYEEWGRHLVKGFSGSGWSKVQMQHDPRCKEGAEKKRHLLVSEHGKTLIRRGGCIVS